MEQIVKHYVEKLYKGDEESESVIEEIDARDPLLVINDGKMQGFRFFDRIFNLNDDMIEKGPNNNYSGWIYFGEVLTLKDIKERYSNDYDYDLLIKNMQYYHIYRVCHTVQDAFLPMNDNDVTYDKYLINLKEGKRSR